MPTNYPTFEEETRARPLRSLPPSLSREMMTPTRVARRFGSIMERRIEQRKRRKRRSSSLATWCRHYLPHKFNRPYSKMHQRMLGRMGTFRDKRGQKGGAIGPRGNAKTTCVEGVVTNAICEGTERYIVFVSDSTTQAQERLESIAYELTENTKIARAYPHVFGEGPTWNKGSLTTRNGIKVVALGTAKKFRGALDKGVRPTLIIGDDLDSDDVAYSPQKREKNWNWTASALLNLGGPDTNYWFNGTAIHRECIVCKLPNAGIRVDRFKSIVKWPKHMELWEEWADKYCRMTLADDLDEDAAYNAYLENREKMDEGAEVLWPEYEPLFELMLLRATIGHRSFQAEKQSEPIDPGMCEWDGHYFDDCFVNAMPANLDCCVVALDPSKGKSDKPGCYQAIIALGVRGPELYIDARIGRWPIDEMINRFVEHIELHRPDVAVVEDAVFQELILPMVSDVADERGLLAPVEGISHEGVNKHVRIRRLSPFVTRNQLHFVRNQGTMELIAQMRDFPNAEYEDGPDALEMALRKARRLLAGKSRRPATNPL